jgi:hypothetical protein
MTGDSDDAWPALPYEAWRDTCETLHLWTQVVGKVRLAQTPWLNHSWHVPLYVSARGLTTSLIPFPRNDVEIEFDFVDHALAIRASDGGHERLALRPQTVADFHARVLDALTKLGLPVTITELPCEIPNAVPFSQDRVHAAYDAQHAHRFWRALRKVDRVFKYFRTGFLGKSSPVHFFWGSFDLAVTRFTGRRAPTFNGSAPGVDVRVMQEAYSHEVSSAGFWPGGNGVDASFYSYAYPVLPGFRQARVRPDAARYDEALGEFLLPYEAVRTATDPEAMLLDFLDSTYAAAASDAAWDRGSLECPRGAPGVCRLVDA